ncbi:MAG: hypothetical protein J7641_22965 [Cyanobacteria bacterium SID2]|nr:hypothetical protein [Cyanobacteria bacterium SID2]MBP0003960.1 hypothetical protein [Cyanobacteria bacterium SBC]
MNIRENARERMTQRRLHDEHRHESSLERAKEEFETTNTLEDDARQKLTQERLHDEHRQELMRERTEEEMTP